MYAVGRIGSYISRGVYTVSGPFHPFGGAVDIIVIEQPDGSFKSSPWYVRFGKFQGVLKSKEKVVNISVNEVEADFHMYLDNKGEAYFLREVHVEEGDPACLTSSSGEEADGKSCERRSVKSKSGDYDSDQANSVTEINLSNGKILATTNSRHSRILGLVFGRKSMKRYRFPEEGDSADVGRTGSLERAEIAADLLETKWSTNLNSDRCEKDVASRSSLLPVSDGDADKGLQIDDGKCEVDSLVHDIMKNSSENPLSHEEHVPQNLDTIDISTSTFLERESFIVKSGVEMSCSVTEYATEAPRLSESYLVDNKELNFEISSEIHEFSIAKTDQGVITTDVAFQTLDADPQILDYANLEACSSEKLDKKQVIEEKDGCLSDGGAFREDNGAIRAHSSVYDGTSESSRIELDGNGEKGNETLYISCGDCREVCVCAETLNDMNELISEVNCQSEARLHVTKEPPRIQGGSTDEGCCSFLNDAMVFQNEEISSCSFANNTVTETYSQIRMIQQLNSSVEEDELQGIASISGFKNSSNHVLDLKVIGEEDNHSKLELSLQLVGDPQEITGDNLSTESTRISPSEGSEEEQLPFGELDDFKTNEDRCLESIFPDHAADESRPPIMKRDVEISPEAFSSIHKTNSSPEMFIQKDLSSDEDLTKRPRILSSGIDIPTSSKVVAEEDGRIVKSLPSVWTHDKSAHDLHYSLGHSFDPNSESSRWMLKSDASFVNSDVVTQNKSSATRAITEDVKISEDLKTVPASHAGDPCKGNVASGGSWRLWSFPFKKSQSMKDTQPDLNCKRNSEAENALERSSGMEGEKDGIKPRVSVKEIRELTPTSEQLASLNLRKGRNAVTFTFSTAMLGKQQVDARIYLWRWDTRIVISDVDGTITKSDVLGQFMPLVGMDWSQSGVAHFFSAIKENGYQFLFLSARAISQAYHTRQFLFNLKQDGKALPDGPVVISPDGLFPSLFREVIRRAPHEFKIACLEEIKALFPSDRNPYYAGFGNRDTDEISYLKVGIPKGKIFIINPKGEVAVHRRVDTKSYSSLHALVHGMFPSISSYEQEDFNSWNYWKLPPPGIDM